MGYDLLAAVFFIVMTPAVIAGFALFWVVNARDREELASRWREYAARRGLDFVEAQGDWPNRTAPAIEWKDADATVQITAVGREARVRTRLVVRPRGALLGTLAVSIDGGGAGAIAVRARPEGLAPRIFSERVRRAILGFRQRDRVTLVYRRGRVIVEWPGGEQNDARGQRMAQQSVHGAASP